MPNKLEDNQAKKLHQLFEEVVNEQPKHENIIEEKQDFIEVDVLNLPPRSEVHLAPKRKFTLNLKHPVMRFIFVLIILVLLISIVYFVFGDQVFLFFM